MKTEAEIRQAVDLLSTFTSGDPNYAYIMALQWVLGEYPPAPKPRPEAPAPDPYVANVPGIGAVRNLRWWTKTRTLQPGK